MPTGSRARISGEAWIAAVRSVEETLLGSVRPVVRVSIAAALLVLVVSCANTVTLLIGRSVVRSREFAVRIALGSSRARLVRAALVEGLALALCGLFLGLAAAWAGLRLFTASAAGIMPRLDGVTIDLPVILTGLVLTLLIGVVCGGSSTFTATRRDAAVLRGGAVATGSPGTRRLRAGLVAAQIALSIVLLTGTGLLVRTVDRLLDEDSGFETRRALTARLVLAESDPSFLGRFAQCSAAAGRKRRYIGRTRDELYPDGGYWRDYYEKLPGGWLVATHMDNDLKRRIIDQAAETAGWSREDIVLPF